MTAQRSDEFINNHPEFEIGDLRLFHIHGYEIKTEIEKPEKAFISSLWRGYIGTYQLNTNGSLCLTKISVFTGKRNAEFEDLKVNEEITGNFRLDFREQFFGNRLSVPFEGGTIILDQSQWFKQVGSRGDSAVINEMFPNVEAKS